MLFAATAVLALRVSGLATQSPHPFVTITSKDVERVNAAAAGDPKLKALIQALRTEGNKLAAQDSPKRVLNPDALPVIRQYLHRFQVYGALYQLDHDAKWLDAARRDVKGLTDFEDWNPAHFLDVAEATYSMSIAYDWLYDGWTEDERTAIATTIRDKGLQPGLDVYEGRNPKMRWWVSSPLNWNIVCNSGLSIGALAVHDRFPEIADNVLKQAKQSIKKGLATYGTDGGWPEGMGYWQYAGRYAVPFFTTLTNATGSDEGLSSVPGLAETGIFRLHDVAPSGRFFDFADTVERQDIGFPWLHWFADKYGKPVLHFAAQQRATGTEGLDVLWYRSGAPNPSRARVPLDARFDSVPCMMFRSRWDDPNALFAGFYGGANELAHSHLEMGAIVIEADGERWVSKLGPDSYGTPGYFEPDKRFNIFRLRTEAQNTLLLGKKQQAKTGRGKILAFRTTPEKGYGVFDITSGYPDATRVWRGLLFGGTSRSTMTVQDEVDVAQPIDYRWQIYTTGKVAIAGAQATLTLNGKRLVAKIVSPPGLTFKTEDAVPESGDTNVIQGRNSNAGFTRLAIDVPFQAGTNRVVVQFVPDEMVSSSVGPRVAPLSSWIAQSGG